MLAILEFQSGKVFPNISLIIINEMKIENFLYEVGEMLTFFCSWIA